ncbi:MAG TPA: class 1 isoprenoid biosynthesis enzyme [Verrucomicrobiae bacterium]|nr:class 1 isoprenoid biosynthesis enzyme [Verrucomicrobiae bacterium]
MLHFLRAQVADAVITHAEPTIHADLIRLLSRPGYALHPEGTCRAGLFALEVYRSARGRYDSTGLVAAAAVELQMQSASVFDEVADGDACDSRAEDLALAIALFTAGTAAAAEATSGLPGGASAMRHFCVATSGACAGQFLDARLGRRGGATYEEALHMTRLKSGSLGAFAAGFAARLAGIDPGLSSVFESLGFNLFTCAQLVDDQRDACAPGERCDLARSKATLPVVYFVRQTSLEPAAASDGTLSPKSRDAYQSSGAPIYAAVLSLAYMGRARADLRSLAERGCATTSLEAFVGRVESEAALTLCALGSGVVV